MPDTPGKSVPGRLHVSAEGAVSLDLLGHVQEGSLPSKPIEILYGAIENGKLVTLLDSQYSHSSLNLPGIATAQLQSSWAFIGFHPVAREDLSFSKVYFHVEGLDRWLSLTGINVQFESDFGSATITYKPLPSFEFPLENGLKLGIVFSWELPSLGSNVESASVSQRAMLYLETPSLMPVVEFLAIVYRLNCFLCLAMNETASLTQLQFTSPKLIDQFAGQQRELLVDAYGRTMPQSESAPKLSPFGQLFTYHQVKDRFAELISEWLQNFQTIEPSFNLYFAVATSGFMFLESQFLFLVQGLETLHRRTSQETKFPSKEFDALLRILVEACPKDRRGWLSARLKYANELTLRHRLEELLGGLSRIVWPGGDHNFPISDIVDTRNYLTHFDSELEGKASHGRDLFSLTQMLQAAFALILLGQIGFKTDEIRKVAEDCQGMMRKLNRQI